MGPIPLLLLLHETLQTFLRSMLEGGASTPVCSQNGSFHYQTEEKRRGNTVEHKQLGFKVGIQAKLD